MFNNRFRSALAAACVTAVVAVPAVAVNAQTGLVAAVEVPGATVATGFVPVPAYRVFDSRSGAKITNLPIEADISERPAVYVPNDIFGNAQIPETATAVTYNVTITQTEGAGFINIDGWAVASDQTSVIAWDEGAGRVSNSGTSILTSSFDDLGYLGIIIGGDADAAAHVLIDITGYYVRLSDIAPATDI